MNYKTTLIILICGLFSSTVWLGLNALNASDETVSQELEIVKAELTELRSLMAKSANNTEPPNPVNQAKHDQKAFSRQQIALLQNLLQTALKDVEVNAKNDVNETPEDARLREEVALQEEALQIQATVDLYNSRLEQEVIDATWSEDIEQQIWDTFDKTELQDMTLLATDCRSTFCRITIKNNHHTNFSPGQIMIDVFSSSEGFFNTTVDSNGTPITEMYVSRSHYHLPKHPEVEGEI